MIFSEFDSYRESKSLQWMCPCALLGRDLPLRHHRHRLHHEEDGYVLGWSLQVRTGTCPVWVASPLTWIMRRYERWWPRLFNTLYRWINFEMFQGWRKMYFYNLALILPSHESSSSSAALLSLEKVKVLDTQSCPTLWDPMEFSMQEYWSGLPFPSPEDLHDPGIEPGSPALQADSLPSEPPGKSWVFLSLRNSKARDLSLIGEISFAVIYTRKNAPGEYSL